MNTYWFGWTHKRFCVKETDYVWYKIKCSYKPSISDCLHILSITPNSTENKTLIVLDTKPSHL